MIETDSHIEKLNLKIKELNPDDFNKRIKELVLENIKLKEILNETETKFIKDVQDLENEIMVLKNEESAKVILHKKLQTDIEKLRKTIESQNGDIFVLQTDVYNEQRLKTEKDNQIKNLENDVVKLSDRINNINSRKESIDFAGEIVISKQREEIDLLEKKNIYLAEEIDKLTRKNVELITFINTVKNSKAKRTKFCTLI